MRIRHPASSCSPVTTVGETSSKTCLYFNPFSICLTTSGLSMSVRFIAQALNSLNDCGMVPTRLGSLGAEIRGGGSAKQVMPHRLRGPATNCESRPLLISRSSQTSHPNPVLEPSCEEAAQLNLRSTRPHLG